MVPHRRRLGAHRVGRLELRADPAHLAVANLGRVYLYGPPGVLLLLNDTPGGHEIRPALTWGVSVYLTEFRVPGVSRPAQLFVNLSKCWTRGGYQNGLNMSGLSVTLKK